MNIAEIIHLKFPNVDLTKDVLLRDDGEGPYIKKWDDSLGPKPTEEILAAWELEVAPLKEASQIRQRRREEYMPIGDQLDALWHAMDDGRLPQIEPIYTAHKLVKDKYKKV